jgi:hypothetical protein
MLGRRAAACALSRPINGRLCLCITLRQIHRNQAQGSAFSADSAKDETVRTILNGAGNNPADQLVELSSSGQLLTKMCARVFFRIEQNVAGCRTKTAQIETGSWESIFDGAEMSLRRNQDS